MRQNLSENWEKLEA